jgi:alpha-glucosidase (family GH31 glycosyl hydrolase)
MNEIENFCDGACDPSQRSDNSIQNRLPYIPGGRSLEELTISLDGRHGDGFTVLDTHNLFATMQTQATHAYFTKDANPVRGLVVSRSGSQGIGQFGARQLGNNFSDKKYMGYSVTSIMAQNIAGVPMAGADICGFFGNTTADLCARWYVVGAF